ncbi:DUF4397 domain-containing protein [Pedobacter nyackensis]|uniref:DUF4397 domain-containing protein n=1 Tax=Pedobacter nyackensis TaxID=475255 RepID=A0A1W2ESV7_9SPHI|nr:DUF4397 domain-containing protein [Pedobacter nyackensis]SMD12731.1 protein of unknown function [Pedobacter nyackensis]
MNISIKKLSAVALLSISALTFQSCSKDPVAAPEIAYLNLINASPTVGTFNIYLDKNLINQNGAVAFNGSTGYSQTSPGSHSVKFTTASMQNVITKNITLEANTINSLFLIDKGENIDFFKIKDNLGNLASAKAFVRFINLSPNAPALNLAVKEGEVVISDKAYKTSSEFIEIEPKAYVFQIKDKATGTTAKAELESVELKAGKSYTIIATGLLNPSDIEQPFGGKLMINQ